MSQQCDFCPFHRLVKIKEYVDKHDPGATIIPISGAFEQTYIEIEGKDEKKKFLEDNKCARYGTISLKKHRLVKSGKGWVLPLCI